MLPNANQNATTIKLSAANDNPGGHREVEVVLNDFVSLMAKAYVTKIGKAAKR